MAGAWRGRAGPLWWNTGLLFAASRLGDLINLYIGAVFLPGALAATDLGSIEPVQRLAALGAIPIGIITAVGAKYISAYHAAGAGGKIKRWFIDTALLAAAASMGFVLVLVLSYESFRVRMDLAGSHVLAAMCGLAVLACWQPAMAVMLQGTQRFTTLALVGFVEPAIRLALALVLIPRLMLSGYLAAMCFSGFCVLALGWWSVRRFVGRGVVSVSYYSDWRGILSYMMPLAVFIVIGSLQAFIEPFVVKHYLPARDAAGYYVVNRFASIPTYLVGAIGFVLLPLLSHRHERGQETRAYLRQALAVGGALTMVGTVVLGLALPLVLGMRAEWQPYQSYAIHAWGVGLVVSLSALAAIYATHEMACRCFTMLWVIVPVTVLECAGLYAAFGWGALKEWVPASLWAAVDARVPRTLGFAIGVMLTARAAIAGGLLLHWRWRVGRVGAEAA